MKCGAKLETSHKEEFIKHDGVTGYKKYACFEIKKCPKYGFWDKIRHNSAHPEYTHYYYSRFLEHRTYTP